METIVEEDKKWIITDNGDLLNNRHGYLITKDRFQENDWFLHLKDKAWMDFNIFIPLYFEACKKAGIKELKIVTFYHL